MTDSRRRNDPLSEIFDPKFWNRFDKQVRTGFEQVFRSVAIRKELEVVTEATEETPAEYRSVLVATLDIPGVPKENVSVEFAELDYGFTRLSITTKRGDDENLSKVEFRETVLASEAKAVVDLGVLTIRVPLKTDDTKTKTEVPIS